MAIKVMTQRVKAIIATAFAIVIIIIVVVVAAIVNRPPSTGVRFIVVPDDITVVTGERRMVVDYESIVAFIPGTYELTLSRDYFESTTATVEVKEGEVTSLYLGMEPNGEQGELILGSTKMGLRLERIGGFNVRSGGEKLSNKYSFIDKLPITGKFFTINPCVLEESSRDSIGICIDLPIDNPFYRSQALDALKAAGVDISLWTIIYSNATQND